MDELLTKVECSLNYFNVDNKQKTICVLCYLQRLSGG